MRSRKLLLPALILAAAVLMMLVLSLVTGITKRPEVTEERFMFHISYDYKGEHITLGDEFICRFTGAGQSVDPRDRFYEGVINGNDPEEEFSDCYIIDEFDDGGMLVIITNLYAGYLMGDPQHEDHYSESEPYEPYIAYFDADGTEYSDEGTLAALDVKLKNWDYPQPIENKLIFAGFSRLTPDSVPAMVLPALLALVLVILLVRKDKEHVYSTVDRISLAVNFVMGIVVFHFVAVVCALNDINGSGAGFASQLLYCVPAILLLFVAASVALRRRGFRLSGLIIQIIGPALFVLALLADTVQALL